MNQDTICAIATAQGGAIGCIRVSGPEAIDITSRIFTPAAAGKSWKIVSPTPSLSDGFMRMQK